MELTFVNKGSTFQRSSIVFLLTGRKGTADTRTQCLHLLHQRQKKKKNKSYINLWKCLHDTLVESKLKKRSKAMIHQKVHVPTLSHCMCRTKKKINEAPA